MFYYLWLAIVLLGMSWVYLLGCGTDICSATTINLHLH